MVAVPGSQGSLCCRAVQGLPALIYPLSGCLGSSCCVGFPVFPPTPAPPWLCSGNSSDLVLWKTQILQIVPLERLCGWLRHSGAEPPGGCWGMWDLPVLGDASGWALPGQNSVPGWSWHSPTEVPPLIHAALGMSCVRGQSFS